MVFCQRRSLSCPSSGLGECILFLQNGALNRRRAVEEAVRPKTSEKTSEKIIELMKAKPNITTKELADQLEKSTRNIEMQIAKLKKENKLLRQGPAKGGHWLVIENDTSRSGDH